MGWCPGCGLTMAVAFPVVRVVLDDLDHVRVVGFEIAAVGRVEDGGAGSGEWICRWLRLS